MAFLCSGRIDGLMRGSGRPLLALLVLTAAVVSACAARTPPPASGSSPPRISTDPSSRLATSPHVALGVPVDSDPSDDYLIDKGAFALGYSDARRGPNWVAWRLTRDDLGNEARADDFRADPDLPAGFFKVGPRDYERTGFDRGHMCPSAHRTATRESNSLTFLMTNMQPQVHSLNAGPWKSLETYEREQASAGKVVYVVAGGIFPATPKLIGPDIAVPESNFRVTVVLDQAQRPDEVDASTPIFGTVMPNDASAKGHKWAEFRVAIDEIERRSGYDFLSKLADAVEMAAEARTGEP